VSSRRRRPDLPRPASSPAAESRSCIACSSSPLRARLHPGAAPEAPPRRPPPPPAGPPPELVLVRRRSSSPPQILVGRPSSPCTTAGRSTRVRHVADGAAHGAAALEATVDVTPPPPCSPSAGRLCLCRVKRRPHLDVLAPCSLCCHRCGGVRASGNPVCRANFSASGARCRACCSHPRSPQV
jgi:hypothetical protein